MCALLPFFMHIVVHALSRSSKRISVCLQLQFLPPSLPHFCCTLLRRNFLAELSRKQLSRFSRRERENDNSSSSSNAYAALNASKCNAQTLVILLFYPVTLEWKKRGFAASGSRNKHAFISFSLALAPARSQKAQMHLKTGLCCCCCCCCLSHFFYRQCSSTALLTSKEKERERGKRAAGAGVKDKLIWRALFWHEKYVCRKKRILTLCN